MTDALIAGGSVVAGGSAIIGGSVYARSFFRKRKVKAVMDKHLAAVAEFEADYLRTRKYMTQVADGTCPDHGITQVRKMRKMMGRREHPDSAVYDLRIPESVNKHLNLDKKYQPYLTPSQFASQETLWSYSILYRQLCLLEMKNKDWKIGGREVEHVYEWLDTVMREASDYYEGISHDVRKQWEVELRVAAREIALLCLSFLPDPAIGPISRVAFAQANQQVEAATTKMFHVKKKLKAAVEDAPAVKVSDEEFLARAQAAAAGVDSMSPLSTDEQRLVQLYKSSAATLNAEKQHQGEMFVEQLEGAASAAKNAASFSANTRPQAEALAAENREYALEGIVRIVEENADADELAQLKQLQVANKFLSDQLKG